MERFCESCSCGSKTPNVYSKLKNFLFFYFLFFFTGQRPPVWFCVSCTCMAMVLVGMSNSAGGMGDITVLVSILMDKALSEA